MAPSTVSSDSNGHDPDTGSADDALPSPGRWNGCPLKHRQALASAFIAKAVYGFSTTAQLLDRLRNDAQLLRLCGWNHANQLPHESTFSRAFAGFASSQLPQRLHQAVIAKTQASRLIGHIACDSTAIETRERYPEQKQPAPKKKRYKKGPKAKRSTARSPRNHIEEQRLMKLPELLAELPKDCSLGVKKSSKGHLNYWRGYKLHIDVADGDIPISALLTAAKLHDSQAAVALMTMTRCEPKCLSARTRNTKTVVTLEPIHRELAPAERIRFRQRTSVERVNARLKDHFGARSIYYRGATKMGAQLMFSVLALTVDQWLKLAG